MSYGYGMVRAMSGGGAGYVGAESMMPLCSDGDGDGDDGDDGDADGDDGERPAGHAACPAMRLS